MLLHQLQFVLQKHRFPAKYTTIQEKEPVHTELALYVAKRALCQMLGCSPYESSLAPIICMVGAILFAQK